MTKSAYIPSTPGCPYVSRPHRNRRTEADPLPERTSQQIPGQNPILNGLQKWVEVKPERPAPVPSKRRLKDCTEDQRRVLGVRCYHERWIYDRNDVEASARLDIAIEDLDTLYKKKSPPMLPEPEVFDV